MSLEDKLYPLLSFYERLPQGVQAKIGAVYRHLPERIRRGRAYREFKQLARGGAAWDAEQIRDYQLRELRRVLHHANAYCPWYQRRFADARFRPEYLRTLDDLGTAPFLTKQDLLEHREEMVSSDFPASARLYITTGGSTGVPVGFYLQKGISRPKEQAFLETMWHRAGYFEGARLALIRGHVTSARAEGQISHYDATRDWLMLSSYHLTPERLPEYLAALEQFQPDLLYVYPSSALQLAECLHAAGQSWTLPLRGILCGSERLTLPQKRLIEETFHCRAYAWYGHSERAVLAAQGTQSDHYYFVPQYGYVEFGPPTPEGLREVIGTSFHNLAMPLIRYRTGDYVRLAPPGMALEFPVPAAVEIAGREQEFLVSATGRKISLTAFNMHDDIFDGLYAVQFFQSQPGAAEFRYVAGPEFAPERLAAIEAGLRRKLGDDFAFEMRPVREVEKTAAGKHKWLVTQIVSSGQN